MLGSFIVMLMDGVDNLNMSSVNDLTLRYFSLVQPLPGTLGPSQFPDQARHTLFALSFFLEGSSGSLLVLHAISFKFLIKYCLFKIPKPPSSVPPPLCCFISTLWLFDTYVQFAYMVVVVCILSH